MALIQMPSGVKFDTIAFSDPEFSGKNGFFLGKLIRAMKSPANHAIVVWADGGDEPYYALVSIVDMRRDFRKEIQMAMPLPVLEGALAVRTPQVTSIEEAYTPAATIAAAGVLSSSLGLETAVSNRDTRNAILEGWMKYDPSTVSLRLERVVLQMGGAYLNLVVEAKSSTEILPDC